MTPAACFLLSLQISAMGSGTCSCWLCPVLRAYRQRSAAPGHLVFSLTNWVGVWED